MVLNKLKNLTEKSKEIEKQETKAWDEFRIAILDYKVN